jgi:hypothetical protein
MGIRFLLAALALSAMVVVPVADAKPKSASSSPVKLDLADRAAGVYAGDVISDARGSSHSGVTITVKKAGPNTVEVTSDYPRLPAFKVKLTRAMQTIQQASGDDVFLIDQSQSPWTLNITVDDASWAGKKIGS